MRSEYLSLFRAFVGVLLVQRAGASCYYPDGTFPSDYVYEACTGDTYSSCCIPSEGDQCLSNGLCSYPGGDYVFRGACTDKTWQAEECFQHCKSGDSADAWDELVSCGGSKYCCSSEGSTCCNDDSKVFDVGTASIINDFSASSSSIALIATATDEPTAQPTDVGAGAQPTSSSRSSVHSGSKTTHSAVSTGTTAAAATASSILQPQPNQTSPVAIYAGVAAGVVILVLAIFLIWFFLRRHYKKKAGTVTTNSISYPLSSAGFERLPDKSPRPVEAPVSHQPPAPPYQPPAYQPQYQNPTVPGAMELDSSYNPPRNNHYVSGSLDTD